jgi:hypothetical protein
MSWFKFKRRNRRVARLHLLDVKLRSAQVRANRIRFAMLSLTLLAVTLAGFYGCWRMGAQPNAVPKPRIHHHQD